jgi:hypothetical protein
MLLADPYSFDEDVNNMKCEENCLLGYNAV